MYPGGASAEVLIWCLVAMLNKSVNRDKKILTNVTLQKEIYRKISSKKWYTPVTLRALMRQDLELHERVPGKPLYWLVDPYIRYCPLSTQSCLSVQHDCNNTKRPLFISIRAQ